MTFSDDIARARKEPEVALQNVDPRVRCAALASLATRKQLGVHWDEVCHDASWLVRRRACELAAHTNLPPDAALIDLLGDEHPLVTEAAAFALGESECVGAVPALVSIVSHDDPLVREAVVAALGAIGDLSGFDAVLAGLRDKPPIRRRAVCACCLRRARSRRSAGDRFERSRLASPTNRGDSDAYRTRRARRRNRKALAARAPHEHVSELIEALDAAPGTEHDRFERLVDHVHR